MRRVIRAALAVLLLAVPLTTRTQTPTRPA